MSEFIKMNRRDWIKRALTKTKDASLKTTIQAAGSFADLSETLKEYKWETLISNRDFTVSPKQLMFRGKLLFLVRVDGQVKALHGICPVDQQLIFWQGHTQQFFCPSCNHRYNSLGNSVRTDDSDEERKVHLQAIPVRVVNEQIQLKID
ncbi:hypothetical protein BHU72_11215 [Desulfuribacillus stibiiarsenatis]|uniref:Rieske domain-containing protein n=1 Tax=Desulfuribacillus stibiiarsenatis TaxID=1390249 RepID=A0A1E5L2K1_9FIRM|nr:hypothetical protein [Desulfuribacillus stibiiarsenatis]OEH84365.1 hypothetical protein BHU72_11215 [Desulfuribacillus stibiiarsenatis]